MIQSIGFWRAAGALYAIVFVHLLWPPAVLAGDGGPLPRSAPEKQGVNSDGVLQFIEAADSQIDALHSFMLVRHCHVVAEGWWAPYDAKTRHVLHSLSKSFASTAVGLAVAEGRLSVDDEVLKFFPDEAPAEPSGNLKAMRVSDLLRMATGHQTEAPLWRGDPATPVTESWVKRFLAHPVPFKPGTHFMYNSPATYMLSAIVQKVTGQSMLEYLRPRLLDPLGFEDPSWLADPRGISIGAFGFFARTEEIAKFGQLYLQRGHWRGKQLLPASWVEQATARQTSSGSSPQSDWDQGYGYQFWRSRHNSYRGDGAFGQYCLVLPEQDAVVAITSGVRDMQPVLNLVWEKLLPALESGPLPANAPSAGKLAARLAGLSLRAPQGQERTSTAAKVSGTWYEFAENDRGIQAAMLDFATTPPRLVVRTAAGKRQTSIGHRHWVKNTEGYTHGVERLLGVPEQPLVAASGAWTADNDFTVKLAVYETSYVATLKFQFDGDRMTLEAEFNVAFGPTKLPRLSAVAAAK